MNTQNNNQGIKVSINEFNKNVMSPIQASGFVIGHIDSIHGEGSKKLTIELPLETIERLISSYYASVLEIDSFWTYFESTGSFEIRMKQYAYNMLDYLVKCLDQQGLNGKEVEDKVYDSEFAEEFKKLNTINMQKQAAERQQVKLRKRNKNARNQKTYYAVIHKDTVEYELDAFKSKSDAEQYIKLLSISECNMSEKTLYVREVNQNKSD